jgi:hypothetical protein
MTYAILLVAITVATADEVARGKARADGSLNTRMVVGRVPTTRGAENFFAANPMELQDWSNVSVVRNSLLSEIRSAKGQGARVASYQEALRPIFLAMPKDAVGRLSNGTARYALHRFFSETRGWAIKGLQPAGAGWLSTLSVSPAMKEMTKFMVPSFLQDLLSAELAISSFDLHSLAILAAAIEHLIHAEMTLITYRTFRTLILPIPGKRTGKEVDEVLDTFMMVYALGLNLDHSMADDVQRAKAHLQHSHSGWLELQAFAQGV